MCRTRRFIENMLFFFLRSSHASDSWLVLIVISCLFLYICTCESRFYCIFVICSKFSSTVTHLEQANSSGFKYDLNAVHVKRGSLSHITALKVGLCAVVGCLFLYLVGRRVFPRIRARGEDLSSSARLSSAAADRALFHSLWWKRVHTNLRASIVCALQCLITFARTPY